MFVYELSGSRFESRCSHLNFRSSDIAPALSKEFLEIQENYRVWIHSVHGIIVTYGEDKNYKNETLENIATIKLFICIKNCDKKMEQSK